MRYAPLVLCGLISACATSTASRSPAEVAGTETARRDAGHGGLSFIKDDFETALATAKAQNKPLFVDAWAPW